MTFCRTYSEVQDFHGKGARYYARMAALNGLSLVEKIGMSKRFNVPRIHFLYFHHIFQDEIEPFRKLLLNLAEQHSFISHSEGVDRLINGNIDRPYVCWSSDDGFKNNVDAAKVLNEFGASCCFFINPNTIGLNDYEKVSVFCKERLDMPPAPFMNWNDIEFLLKTGHEIGSHTMNHDFVNKMQKDEFKNDLRQSKEVLESYCGHIKHFAYPYGKFENFSKAAFESVFETGYHSCSTGVRGCHVVDERGMAKEQLFVRREHVVAAWKIDHMNYFLSKSVRNINKTNNYLPAFYH